MQSCMDEGFFRSVALWLLDVGRGQIGKVVRRGHGCLAERTCFHLPDFRKATENAVMR